MARAIGRRSRAKQSASALRCSAPSSLHSFSESTALPDQFEISESLGGFAAAVDSLSLSPRDDDDLEDEELDDELDDEDDEDDEDLDLDEDELDDEDDEDEDDEDEDEDDEDDDDLDDDDEDLVDLDDYDGEDDDEDDRPGRPFDE